MNTPNKPITVIYHRADFDGLFCREIARKFLGNQAEYIGWDYGDAKIPMTLEGTVYILDLSPECLGGDTYDSSRLIWIDHHKTAIEKFPANIPGYRIDGVAACRLAWQWFALRAATPDPEQFALPDKQHFYDRQVQEPPAVRLAGEYDIWDKRDPRADTFQLGLRSVAPECLSWARLLSAEALPAQLYIDALLSNGRLLQDYVNQRDAAIVGALGFVIEFEGLKFLALNSSTKGSLQFAAKDVPETGHDALLKFNFLPGQQWDVSLYHAKHRTDLDLSQIAGKHGGGGHRGACGFRTKTLPFLS
jgi:oligoribonuclease NrnB/cAMP/cGMP phosphodiesterase (DHH superfamily)